jgi:hypothetical protein
MMTAIITDDERGHRTDVACLFLAGVAAVE